jgi:hypothetical protein
MKRIEPLGAASLSGLDGWPDKAALVPILNLPQADANDPARHLAVVRLFHHAPEMKTIVFL